MEKCFADIGKKECAALKEKNCTECNFYKTEKEYLEGVRKTRQQLKEVGGHIYGR